MLEIFLVRHGESLSNAGEKTMHDATVELTALGHHQAKHFATQLITTPSKIIYSPYVRAQQTAAPTIAKFQNTPVEEWAVQEFHYLDPDKLGLTTQSERQKYVEVYWQQSNILYKDGIDCESFADFVGRITKVFLQLSVHPDNQKIIIFSHGYFMKLSIFLIYQNFPAPNKTLMKHFRHFALNYDINNVDTIQINFEQQKWIVKQHIHIQNTSCIYRKIKKYIL